MYQIITTAEKAMEMGVFAAQPGNFLVDFFPASNSFSSVPEKVADWIPQCVIFPGGSQERNGKRSLKKDASSPTIWLMFRMT